MDPVAPFPGIDTHPNWGPINQPDNPLWPPLRSQLGDTRRYALRMDLDRVIPWGELSSTGYCLADPGSTYLAYLMREKKLGSTVALEVLRGGKSIKTSFRIPRKQPEVQGY